MVDMSAIAGTVSALKGAVDIAQAMKTLTDTQSIQSKVIELNGKILDAQTSAFAANDERASLIEKIRALEEEIAGLKAWDTEKQNYKLAEIAKGIVVYVPKDAVSPAEASHKLCANCYEDGKKSHLQIEMRSPGRATVAVCNRCHTELYISGMRQPEHPRRR